MTIETVKDKNSILLRPVINGVHITINGYCVLKLMTAIEMMNVARDFQSAAIEQISAGKVNCFKP